MTDNSANTPRWTRRQLFGTSFATIAAGAVAAIMPELGANAVVRGARATPEANWYMESPVSQVELSASETTDLAQSAASAAKTSAFGSRSLRTAAASEESKAVLRTMTDGRTVKVSGIALDDAHLLATWEETLQDGSPGRSVTIVHEVTADSMTVVAIGGAPASLQNVSSAADATAADVTSCPTGTHLFRYCTNLQFDAFAACCGGCAVTFLGSPIAGGLCALIVCSSCYSVNCKAWANTCVINS